jgi:mercuric ion transport protein
MSLSPVLKSGSCFSRGRLGWAGVAAVLGCAACCAIPLLAAAGLGGGALATLSHWLHPGAELLVGGVVFASVLGVLAVRHRLSRASGCGPACRLDGSCCERR